MKIRAIEIIQGLLWVGIFCPGIWASSLFSGERDTEAISWPAEWLVFAPAGKDAPSLQERDLLIVPDQLLVAGQVLKGRKVTPTGGHYDFGPLFGPDRLKQTAYVYLPVNAEADCQVELGFGADWWMQVWLNGALILDTTEDGNSTWPPAIDDHIVTADLQQGVNILTVRFLAGTGSGVLAIGGPDDLANLLSEQDTQTSRPTEVATNSDWLARYPPRPELLNPTFGWAPPFERKIALSKRERVALEMDWGENPLSSAVVTFGVPFARGALPDSRNIRIVDKNGNPAVAGFNTTATWDDPEGPVRWALGHARLNRSGEYFIEYGTDVEPHIGDPLKIHESDETFLIDTGTMQVEISRIAPSVVASVVLRDGTILVDPERSQTTLPLIVDGRSNVYVAANAVDGLTVEIIEAGPVRAAVRRAGWYIDTAGEPFCKFVTYTYFYAGSTGIRHDHTLIVGFDSNEHQIRDLMLPIPIEVSANANAVFAADGSVDGNQVILPIAEDTDYTLLQRTHQDWVLYQGDAEFSTGTKAGGWFGVVGNEGGAFAGLRDFWQNYPASLEVDGAVLKVHLWPADGVDALDFRPSAVMGEDYPGDRVFHQNLYHRGLDEMTQGFGVAKTHSVYLEFFSGTDPPSAQQAIRAHTNEQVLALPDPVYICATDVQFGRVHPYDPEQFPEIEALLDSVVLRYIGQREERELYGWVNFGDVLYSGSLWRQWASMFYGFPNVMPRLYLRSGRRDAWDFHHVSTRHITDIDICHLDSDAFVGEDLLRGEGLRKRKGWRYGGDGGIAHYAAGLYAVGNDHHLEFMLLDYYLNGNLRTWEVANYYMEAAADQRGDAALTSIRMQPHVPNMARGAGGALRLFAEAWQATWDPRYLSIMDQMADLLIEAKEEAYRIGAGDVYTVYNDVYVNKGKILYYQLTGDERMRDMFLHDMEVLAERRNEHALQRGVGTTMSGPAHAWWFTGDNNFLPFMLWQLEVALERGAEWIEGAHHPIATNYGYQLPEVMAVIAAAHDLPDTGPPPPPPISAETNSIGTAWAVYLAHEEQGDFKVVVDCDINWNATSLFANWKEWYDSLPEDEQPVLRMVGPGGDVIEQVPLTAAAQRRSIQIDVPDASVGTYVLALNNTFLPMEFNVSFSSATKRAFLVENNRLSGARTFYFNVPRDTDSFVVKMKSNAVRSVARYAVRNNEGAVVVAGEWNAASSPRDEWEVVKIDADQPASGEVWSIQFDRGNQFFFEFEGIPGFVAESPETLFVPSESSLVTVPVIDHPEDDVTVIVAETDLPWGGPATWLAERVAIASPEPGSPVLNPDQGTMEMWFKTVSPHDSLADKTVLSSGSFAISRRFNIGTYISIGGATLHRRLTLPNNRWTHLALTWQPSSVEGMDLEVRLFVDGTEVRSESRSSRGLPDQQISKEVSGETLYVSGGMLISNLRISDSVRYVDSFERPEAPFVTDENTRLLLPFAD